MDFQECIKYIENRIVPFHLSEHAKNNLLILYKKYPQDILIKSIDISFANYIKYENSVPLRDSVDIAINKIGGIAYNLTLPPIEQEIKHICNKGNYTYNYWDDSKAKVILLDYVKALADYGWDEKQIVEDLSKEVMSLFSRLDNWTQWNNQLKNWIDDVRAWEKNNIESNGSILPNDLFAEAPRNIRILQQELNASYENNLYDCTAIMMRRMIEVLLILSYKSNGIEDEIKNGDYFEALEKIIKNAKANIVLDLSTNTKKGLDSIKKLANLSAHRILFNCTKDDIDNLKLNFRVIIEELLYKAMIL